MVKFSYIQFNQNGEIIANCACNTLDTSFSLTENQLMTTNFIDPKLFYVQDRKIVLRPVQSTVLDGVTLRELPVPSEIFINGMRYECDESTVELDIEAGSHIVVVRSFPYKEVSFEINT